MKRVGLCLIAAGLAIGLGSSGSAQGDGHQLDVVELEGVIDPTSADYLTGTIQEVTDEGSDLVIIQLDTPGGLEVSMREMVQQILSSRVPVVVWVGPPGARAASAGVFLVYASHVAAMAPATNLGAAHPVNLGGKLSETDEEKAVNDAAKFLESLAERRGRSVEFAEAAVRESRSLTALEARNEDVIELIAASVPDLLQQLDGRSVETEAGSVTLVTVADDESDVLVRFHKMGLIRRILHAVTNPTVAFLLLTLGTWAIVFEIAQPGFGVAGISGAVALVLAFYALAVLPINIAGLILVVLGLILFAIDVFTAGLGVFTIGGAIGLGVGSFLLFAGVDPTIRVSPYLIVAILIGSVLFFGFAMTAALQARRRRPISGQEGLIGLTGEARADLSPEGHVWVKGALWKARGLDGPIAKGRTIRVKQVEGLTLVVEEEPEREE